MKKKLLRLTGILSLSVILVACGGSRMRGDTTTVCENAPSTFSGNIGTTVVTIEGTDEDIRTWTERTTFTRDEFNLLTGEVFTDEEIREEINFIGDRLATGVSLSLVSLDANTVVLDYIYNYDDMSLRDLNTVWQTDDFERSVTLSSAIGGLEELGGATCH